MRNALRVGLVSALLVALFTAGTALAVKMGDLDGVEITRLKKTSARGPSDWTASADITRAELYSKSFFKVDTRGGAVDLDFANDLALDSSDIGAEWFFCVGEGGSNALTVTAGASGVTTVKVVDADGTTCEDVGDCIRMIAYSTTQATAFTQCAD